MIGLHKEFEDFIAEDKGEFKKAGKKVRICLELSSLL
jgi:hypothetical protein